MADGTVTVVEDARGVNTPLGAAPPSCTFKEGNGGEFRNTFHGFPTGYGARFSAGIYTRRCVLVPTPARLKQSCVWPMAFLTRIGCSLVLPVGTVNCVQTLKVRTLCRVAADVHHVAHADRHMEPSSVRVFRQECTLDRNLHSRSAIEFHAFAPLEASKRVTNAIPLGCPLLLPVHAVNCVQTLKANKLRGLLARS